MAFGGGIRVLWTLCLVLLTVTTVLPNSADDKSVIFFLLFSQKTGFDISRKWSPEETICLKYQSPFPEENKKKKKCFKMSSDEMFTQQIYQIKATEIGSIYTTNGRRKGHLPHGHVSPMVSSHSTCTDGHT